ncbi:jumonji domain-containing protein, putative [Ixodes scapularis]|uniref:[histone H3]-trimethyl-L-lysine(9) demethylase n=1 Tax=Ixodes scapularis TaxID=6945 RepID=B7PUD4_IXOSC|nr:jumonji domain-containing protein, putative [Ixodes scapularis]|eukprot:XP_002405956.1 jumonji domain-containing protein, putative [Ixodes scapularis]
MEKRPACGVGSSSGIPKIMVFRPTLAEMNDFSQYLEHMESQGAHKAGLAKIIPPREWIPRKSGYEDIHMMIPSPISQVVTGRQGLYQQYNIQKKAMTVKDFKRLAESDRYRTPVHFDYEDLERKYWKNVAYNPPIYGADVSGSLYDPGVKEFNINHLNTILDLVGRDYGIKIEGVNTAYLYFGMWKTTFAWHTEDMDLYSINYLHFGAPKSWYCIPPEHGRRLERLAAGFFHTTAQECSAFLRHKMTVISPQILRQYSIPFNKCMCRQDCVKISMDVFVKKLQPEKYELWLAGKDVGSHPEDPTRVSAAPPPTYLEMAMLARMVKPKSKRHPVAPAGECPAEEDGDTDGTEIYDPEESSEDRAPKRKRQAKVPAQPRRPRAAGAGRAPNGGALKKPPRKPRSQAKPKPVREKERPMQPWALETPLECPLNLSAPARTLLEESPKVDKEVLPTEVNVGRRLCMGTAVRRQPLHPAPKRPRAPQTGSGADSDDGLGAREPGVAAWASPYMDLWSFRPTSLYAERQFNRYCSTLEPHCALCILFRPLKYGGRVGDGTGKRVRVGTQYSLESAPREPPQVPESSAVWMPALCLANGAVDPGNPRGLPEMSEVVSSPLLVCSECSVCVHAHCYGVEQPVSTTEPWKCDRCAQQAASVDCCLCTLRGGALKQTVEGRWAHLLCALLVPEVHVGEGPTRSPVDVRHITPQRARLRCWYCHKLRDLLGRPSETGACIQCTFGRCTTAFHVTCAHAAGVSFETYDWPLPIFVTCTKHANSPNQKASSPFGLCLHFRDLAGELPPVAVGSRVVAKHKNGRYYWGRVRSTHSQDLYSVDFEDHSSSNNLLPEDIVSRDCVLLGPPSPGELVSVRWTDGKLYQSIFKSCTSTTLYTVVFEDESERNSKREAIYAEGEELPKRVKSRLSSATEGQHTDLFKELPVEGRRKRVGTARYHTDDIVLL